MIVAPLNSGLLLVRQPEHAALAARIGEAWLRPWLMPKSIWRRFLEAVRIHDDGWTDAESHPSLDPSGLPHDFKSLPLAEHARVWRRNVNLAQRSDLYAGLLVAMHAEWLYVHYVRKETAEERGFRLKLMSDLVSLQRELADRLLRGSPEDRDAARPDRALAARRLLTFLDSLSLFALGAVPAFTSGDPVEFGGEMARHSTGWEDGDAFVAPWAFETGAVSLEYRAVQLDRSSYKDPADFVRAMTETGEKVIRATLTRRKLKEEKSPPGRPRELQGLG